jgi:rRNA pseudouridine-1189 N-methylase Emg1 (Nep1/Mra1 family)
MFISLGYFLALDFVAATSWYWHIPEIYRTFIGLMVYLFSLIWIRPLENFRVG